MKLLLEYLLLCLFKRNPNDFNPSKSFVWNCVIFYLVSGIIVESNISDPADATLEVGMRAFVAVVLITGTAFASKQWSRFVQLLTAIFVCENFMMTLGIGAEVLDRFLQRTQYEDLSLYLGGALILWYLAILGYILRKMFSYNIAASLILAFCYFALAYGGPFLVMEVI